MRRIVVLGTGTGVGKTYVATRLIAALARADRNVDVVGIKAVETGFTATSDGSPRRGSDAHALESVSRGTPIRPHPVLSFETPVSPHLAAATEHRRVGIAAVVRAIRRHARSLDGWQVIETAGGAFSPLGKHVTNVDLAKALEPAIWVLVAADALGVLHDVRATLLAMRSVARTPDHLVLSGSRKLDASAGTNAKELRHVGLPKPAAVIERKARTSTSLDGFARKLAKLNFR